MDRLPTVVELDDGYTLILVTDQQARLDSEDWMHLFQGIVDHGSRGVIIDCSGVITPSSPFMSALAWCRQLARQNGFDTCLIGCHGRLSKALQVTDLTRVLLIAEDQAAAMQLLSGEDDLAANP